MMIGIRWIGTSQCPCGMGCPVTTPNNRAINSMGMMMMFIQVLECLLSQVLTVLFPFHPKSGKRFFDIAHLKSWGQSAFVPYIMGIYLHSSLYSFFTVYYHTEVVPQ